MRLIHVLLLVAVILFTLPLSSRAQLSNLHGDETYSYNGLHSGNQIRTNFYNDGMVGKRYTSADDIMGEWPINEGHGYIHQFIMFVGSEVKDSEGQVKHIISEGNGCMNDPANDAGDQGPSGEWWSMAPLPGFANNDEKRIAMSHWDWSWPSYWPDKMDDAIDAGWPGSWNGYFGKNVYNADQESYYVMDDYNNREFSFYPDSTNSDRRGLGLRATVRGFQWSNVLVEDILFVLADYKNIGTTHHDKMNFGVMSGPIIGEDGSDDGGAYSLEEDLGFHFDEDNIGSGSWTPVGLHGLAFFESPGNPFDGIDNDGDGINGSGDIITESMFEPRTIQANDDIVLIDYTTFNRTATKMPAEGVTITYLEKEYKFVPGGTYTEITNNLIDDNLNGIIDENNGTTFGEGDNAITNYLYVGQKYVNHITGNGIDNLLIDEKRDDGIDNDGDWNAAFDDVGMDGVANSGDQGEGDGQATSGAGTDLPGEPAIDKTDISESDMIGLTAFNIYTPWTLYPLNADETLWEGIAPGYLDEQGQIGDTDILMGSGFFPLKPEQIERFSLGILFGWGTLEDYGDLLRNKQYAEQTYLENYNFAKAPYIPEVEAIAGDNRVTLIWDDYAESSDDPITGQDFEGYRIYRSTDPGFNDMLQITDGYGSASYKKPIAQYDLANGITGFSPTHVNGIEFYLGDDTGLTHTWTDTTAVNGQKYYYAVTSYDRGDQALGIAPSECSKYISIGQDGVTVDKGKNVAIVRPEAPVAGFLSAGFSTDGMVRLPGTTADGEVGVRIINPMEIKDKNTYHITFEDSLNNQDYPLTKAFNLINVTNPSAPDTLLKHCTFFNDGDDVPVVEGLKLAFHSNPDQLAINSDSSMWNREEIYNPQLRKFNYSSLPVELMPGEFRIDFGVLGIDTSTFFMRGSTELPAIPVNFTITNTKTNKKVKFALRERDALAGEEGYFTARTDRSNSDEIIFLSDSLYASWQVSLIRAEGDSVNPEAGDFLIMKLTNPFLPNDVFEFSTEGQRVDLELAAQNIDKIRVVPNPYIVANSWEPYNPYSDGRGPRELHFIHLPQQCTIKIFNVRGQLVQKLEHNSPGLNDGTEIWDMLTKDLLDISYGVYIYIVEAPGIGTKTGKFAVIK